MKLQYKSQSDVTIGARHIGAALIIGVSCLLLWSVLRNLVHLSLHNPEYSHLLLMPGLSLYLLWSERNRVFKQPKSSPRLALCALCLGLCFFIGSSHVPDFALTMRVLALILFWLSGMLLCYGFNSLRHSGLAIIFLFLMTPLPEPVLARVIAFLQHGSAQTAEWLFNIVGMPVYRNDVLIYLPKLTLEVAPECSGIRSSVGMFITGLLAVHYLLRSFPRKILFMLFVLPVLILKNGIRIFTLAVLALYVDPGFLTGRLHHAGGFVFYLLGLLALVPLLEWLRRTETRQPETTTIERGITAPSASF